MKSINNLLQNCPVFIDLTKKLDQLALIQEQVDEFLTKKLDDYPKDSTIVANYSEGVLLLVTDQKNCLSQLHYTKMDLLNHLRVSNVALAGISSIKIKLDYVLNDLITLSKQLKIKS